MKKKSGVRKECLATSSVHIGIFYIAYTFATIKYVLRSTLSYNDFVGISF